MIDSVKGAFEAGFDHGGQTREHVLLVKSLGISQLIVAVNKMDQCGWEFERFREVSDKLKPFLNQTGYKVSSITYDRYLINLCSDRMKIYILFQSVG